MPEQASLFSPATILRAVRKHWIQVILTLLLAIGATAAYNSSQTPLYEAVASVQLDPQPLAPLGRRATAGGESGPEGFWSSLEYFQTQQQIITSRRMAILVVKKLGLDRDSAFLTIAPAATSPRPADNHHIPAAREIGWESWARSAIPKAFTTPMKWIKPCATKSPTSSSLIARKTLTREIVFSHKSYHPPN
jgi:hypothetical protein